ncbi:hypothetical protein [Streptomyces mirabilis]|uniref:hypothetical protein n=1 Tax=Streptomyces mirabilis TaxID=68239 RepID=UPI00368C0534
MDAQRAVDLINKISYRPGWEINAHLMIDGLPYVIVIAHVHTVNSDQDQAIKGYPEKIILAPDTMIDAGLYDTPEALYGRILDWIIGLEIHEAREFLRVGDDMRAPFHPHRPECQDAWDRVINAREVAA